MVSFYNGIFETKELYYQFDVSITKHQQLSGQKTVVPPYPQFGFPWFQLREVNCGLETDDPLTHEKVISSLTLRHNACITHLTFPYHVGILFYHFTSSHEQG